MTTDHQKAVTQYFADRGWNTAVETVRDGVYVVGCMKDQQGGTERLLVMVVTEPATDVSREDLTHLDSIARERDVGTVLLTATTGISSASRQMAADVGVEIRSPESLVDGNGPRANANRRSSASKPASPSEGTAASYERQPPRGEQPLNAGRGQPRNGRPQQPRQPRQSQQPRQGNNPNVGRAPASDDGISRRTLLAGGGAIAAAGAGGWYFFLRSDTLDSPEAVVKAMLDAIESGDTERARELYHEDSPDGSRAADIARQVGEGSEEENIEPEFTLETMEILERGEDISRGDGDTSAVAEFALAEVTYTLSAEGLPGNEEESIRVMTAEHTDGGWTLWWAGF